MKLRSRHTGTVVSVSDEYGEQLAAGSEWERVEQEQKRTTRRTRKSDDEG